MPKFEPSIGGALCDVKDFKKSIICKDDLAVFCIINAPQCSFFVEGSTKIFYVVGSNWSVTSISRHLKAITKAQFNDFFLNIEKRVT